MKMVLFAAALVACQSHAAGVYRHGNSYTASPEEGGTLVVIRDDSMPWVRPAPVPPLPAPPMVIYRLPTPIIVQVTIHPSIQLRYK